MGVRGFGVRSLQPGVQLDVADIGAVDEVWFIVAGVGSVLTGEAELPVQPGDVVLTPAGDRRGIRNTGIEPLVFAGFAADVVKTGLIAPGGSRWPAAVEGGKLPAFSATDTDGKKVSLKDFAGKKNVVLYFYPRDLTPGCTTQACGFRDAFVELTAADTVVLGAPRTMPPATPSSPPNTTCRSPCSATRSTRWPTSTACGARRPCTAASSWGWPAARF